MALETIGYKCCSEIMDDSRSKLDAGYKVLLTLGVMVLACSVGAIIAKLVSRWYDKKIENRKKKHGRPELDQHARDIVRSRLAIMQFRRGRMSAQQQEPSKAEIMRRKNMGIWAYQPNQKNSVRPEDEIAQKKKKKKNAKQVKIDENIFKHGKESPAQHETEKITKTDDSEPKLPVGKYVETNSNSGISKPAGLTQFQLVTEVNKATPIKPNEPVTGKQTPIADVSSDGGDVTPSLVDSTLSRQSSRNSESFSPALSQISERESKSASGRRLFMRITPNVNLTRSDSGRTLTSDGKIPPKSPRSQHGIRPKSGVDKTMTAIHHKPIGNGVPSERRAGQSAPTTKTIRTNSPLVINEDSESISSAKLKT